jgi:hypothetical protein
MHSPRCVTLSELVRLADVYKHGAATLSFGRFGRRCFANAALDIRNELPEARIICHVLSFAYSVTDPCELS